MSDTIIKVGIIGFGNVGRGVFKILKNNQDDIRNRIGHEIQVKTIVVRDLSKHKDQDKFEGTRFSTAVEDIIQDPDIQVVIEVIGGEFPAFDYISAALKAKKYVTESENLRKQA